MDKRKSYLAYAVATGLSITGGAYGLAKLQDAEIEPAAHAGVGKVYLSELTLGAADGMWQAGTMIGPDLEWRIGRVRADQGTIRKQLSEGARADLDRIYAAGLDQGRRGEWSADALDGYLRAIETDIQAVAEIHERFAGAMPETGHLHQAVAGLVVPSNRQIPLLTEAEKYHMSGLSRMMEISVGAYSLILPDGRIPDAETVIAEMRGIAVYQTAQDAALQAAIFVPSTPMMIYAQETGLLDQPPAATMHHYSIDLLVDAHAMPWSQDWIVAQASDSNALAETAAIEEEDDLAFYAENPEALTADISEHDQEIGL